MPVKTVLLIADSITATELDPHGEQLPLDVVIEGARKIRDGLGISLGVSRLISAPPNAKFYKLKLTTPGAAMRSVFWLEIDAGRIYLLLVRPKRDKKIGEKLNAKNPKLIDALKRNMEKIATDLAQEKARVFEIRG